jgi:hypothetical protein
MGTNTIDGKSKAFGWFDPSQVERNKEAWRQLMAMQGTFQGIACDIGTICRELKKMKIPDSATDVKGWLNLMEDVSRVAPEIRKVSTHIAEAMKVLGGIAYDRLSDADKAKVDEAKASWAKMGADFKQQVEDFFDPNHERHAPEDIVEAPPSTDPTTTPFDDATSPTIPDTLISSRLSKCLVPTSYPLGDADPTYEGVSLDISRANARPRTFKPDVRVIGNVGAIASGLPLGEPALR